MLNKVPQQVNRASRNVTLRHPNAMDCTVYRKTVDRVSTDDPEEFAGLPTIGGLGVLDSEDEADYSFEEIGSARILFCGQFQTGGSNWNDADTGIIYPDQPIEAMIECVLKPEEEGFFTVTKNDMIMVEPGAGIVMPYQAVGETGSVNIPPYTRKFLIQPRADIDVGI